MKKSTEQSAEKTSAQTSGSDTSNSGHQEGKPFWTEVIFTEGGVSLLIIFPLTVLYFLARAIT